MTWTIVCHQRGYSLRFEGGHVAGGRCPIVLLALAADLIADPAAADWN